MKKLTLLVECCRNCVFCTAERKPNCMYAASMVNGDPVPIANPKVIMETCPLLDATPQDKIPAPIYYRVEDNGMLNIVIETD